MKNPICISTGLVYKLNEGMNKKIAMLRDFSIDGMELCFADADDLLNFSINEANLKYLQSFKFNSIHAPWKNIDYGNNNKCKKTLIVIEKLYKEINAINVSFHIFGVEKIKETKIFNEYDFIFSIENNDSGRLKRPGLDTVEKIKKALTINPNFKFTFDFAHALVTSPQEIPVFINKFKNKLTQIHLSYLTKQMKDHWFLHKYDSKEMRNLLNHLKNTNAPIVLECVASNWEEMALVKKEMEYVKSIFTLARKRN